MKYSDAFFFLWMAIWFISSSVDFAFSFGDDKPASVVIESKPSTKKEEKKEEPITNEIPKPTW